jgi:hypothetical protein
MKGAKKKRAYKLRSLEALRWCKAANMGELFLSSTLSCTIDSRQQQTESRSEAVKDGKKARSRKRAERRKTYIVPIVKFVVGGQKRQNPGRAEISRHHNGIDAERAEQNQPENSPPPPFGLSFLFLTGVDVWWGLDGR